jgi:hypothetical protein
MTMPVSKKRKKGGKPVHFHGEAEKPGHVDHPDSQPSTPSQLRSGKPKNPFVGNQPQHRASQRGR